MGKYLLGRGEGFSAHGLVFAWKGQGSRQMGTPSLGEGGGFSANLHAYLGMAREWWQELRGSSSSINFDQHGLAAVAAAVAASTSTNGASRQQ